MEIFWRIFRWITGQPEPQEFSGWKIVHRTSEDYHAAFPEYEARIQTALRHEFPGAILEHQNYHRTPDEPFVVPPKKTGEERIRRAHEKAAEVFINTIRSTNSGNVATPEVPPETVNANEIRGDWVIIVPMMQLKISNDPPINGRWQIGDVTFLSREQLGAFTRPPTLPNAPSPAIWERTVGADECFAVVSRSGAPNELRRDAFKDLRLASNILAATSAFYGRRHHSSGFTLKGYPFVTAKNDRFFQQDGTAFCGNWNQRGFLHTFELDGQWHNAITNAGIIDLFDRVGDTTLDPDWRRQICSAAGMLGRSMMSLELADAFLLNVIGLETLLTTFRQRNGRMLTQRIKGMTGWYLRTHRPNYANEIQTIHDVRCAIVHDSDYSGLTNELLLLSDIYLANSLLNIVRLPAVFPDKATLMNTLDGYAQNENWPTDGTLPFRWFGNPTFAAADLELPLF